METVKFTANEIAVLKAIVETGQRELGPLQYIIEDLIKYTDKSVNSIKGILASLNKKGILFCYAGEYAFDGEVREKVDKMVVNLVANVNSQNNKTENDMETENNKNSMMDERIVRMNEISATKLSAVSKGKRENLKAQKAIVKFLQENWDNVEELDRYTDSEENKASQYELWCIAKSRLDQLNYQAKQREAEEHQKNDEPTSETTPATPVTEKSDKTTIASKAAASKHRVGDLHLNGKWVWLETSPGKFDWRVIGSRRHKEWLAEGGIIPDTPVVEKKTKTPKAKSVKKKAEKPVNMRTIEEILATKPAGVSKPQERLLKLLRKGYRFSDKDDYRKMLFLKKDDAQETTTMDIATALMRRLKATDEEFKQFHV